ncbi:hypothetical protein [Nocardia ninae]
MGITGSTLFEDQFMQPICLARIAVLRAQLAPSAEIGINHDPAACGR